MDQRLSYVINRLNELARDLVGLTDGGMGIPQIVGHKVVYNVATTADNRDLTGNYPNTITGACSIEANIRYALTNSSAGNTTIQLYINDTAITDEKAIWVTNPENTGYYEHNVRFFANLTSGDNVSIRMVNPNTTSIDSFQCLMTFTKLDNGFTITDQVVSGGGGGGGI